MGISFHLPAVPGWLGTLPLLEDIVKCYLKKFPGASRQGSGASAIWSWNTLSLRSSRFGGTEPPQKPFQQVPRSGQWTDRGLPAAFSLTCNPSSSNLLWQEICDRLSYGGEMADPSQLEGPWATSVSLTTNVGTAQVGTVGS